MSQQKREHQDRASRGDKKLFDESKSQNFDNIVKIDIQQYPCWESYPCQHNVTLTSDRGNSLKCRMGGLIIYNIAKKTGYNKDLSHFEIYKNLR